MNIEKMIPIVRAMLPNDKVENFDRAVAAIKEYLKTNKVSSASDATKALNDLNVPIDFLSNTGRLAKNPVVSKIASVFNVDLDRIQEDANNLTSHNTRRVDSLEQYKKDLENIRR